ncbi:MAG: rRNA maturation RNase YbeY [Limisphaerales bacterium]
MTVAITNRQRLKQIDRRLLKAIVNALLAELELEQAEIGICLVAAPEMTRLNETFLRHAGSTDVIAFDYRDKTVGADVRRPLNQKHAPEKKPAPPCVVACKEIHGEIFICVDEAVRQARRFGTSWQSEIVRYLVHGILHLLGFDDSSAGARRRMKRAENRLLRRLAGRFSLAQLSRPARISA